MHVVELVTGLGYNLVPSAGTSRDAVRTVDLDDGLVRILQARRKLQAKSAWRPRTTWRAT